MDENVEMMRAEIVLYQSDGMNVPVEVRYLNETYWLTQKEMAALFGVDRSVVSKHLKNICDTGELDLDSICAKFAHMGSTGQTYQTAIYNLDAVIAVGYRVNSLRATRFRQWATRTLRDVLEGKGSRTHKQAEKKALAEFAKFQKVQDAAFENDFERSIKRLNLNEKSKNGSKMSSGDE